MRNVFDFIKKNKVIAVGLPVLLVCVGITILAYMWNNANVSCKIEQTTSKVITEPPAPDKNQAANTSEAEESPAGTIEPSTSITEALPESESDGFTYDLYSLDFIDANTGWVIFWDYNVPVVYNTTSLYHTTDGGVTWEAYDTKDCLLQKVSFANSEIGWALALEGHPDLTDGNRVTYQILKTEDGGITWKLQLSREGLYGESFDIAAYAKASACAIISGKIYRTNDSGKNWTELESPVKNFTAEHIYFEDNANGWISGAVKTVSNTDRITSDADSAEKDTDSAKENTDSAKEATDSAKGPTDSAVVDKDTAIEDTDNTIEVTENAMEIINYAVYLFHTKDGGENWDQQFSKDCGIDWNEIIGISFADLENGWFLLSNYSTYDGELYHTADSGSNWEKITEKMRVCRPYAQGVEAVTSNTLFIPMHCGAGPIDGGLLYSEDGGKNFNFISTESGIVNSTGVKFFNSSLGWAIMNGYEEKYLIKTIDGGKSWEKIPLLN